MSGHGDFSMGSDVWPGVAKLIEEMGELQQVLGKLIQFRGETTHWDGSDLRERLHDEVADVLAALAFFGQTAELDKERIALRVDQKHDLFMLWQREQSDGQGASDGA